MKVDLAIRPRRATGSYRLQLIKVAIILDQKGTVLVWAYRGIETFLSDLRTHTGKAAFAVITQNLNSTKIYNIVEWFSICEFKPKYKGVQLELYEQGKKATFAKERN